MGCPSLNSTSILACWAYRVSAHFVVVLVVVLYTYARGFRPLYMSCLITSTKLSYCRTIEEPLRSSSSASLSWSSSRASLSWSSSWASSWASSYKLYSPYLFSSLISLRVWPVRIVPAALILYYWSIVRSFELVKRLSRWAAYPFPGFIRILTVSPERPVKPSIYSLIAISIAGS